PPRRTGGSSSPRRTSPGNRSSSWAQPSSSGRSRWWWVPPRSWSAQPPSWRARWSTLPSLPPRTCFRRRLRSRRRRIRAAQSAQPPPADAPLSDGGCGGSHGERGREPFVRGRRLRGREDPASDDEHVGAGRPDLTCVRRLDAAVDLDEHLWRQPFAERGETVERLRHEGLPRVAGVDAHAEHEVDGPGRLERPLDRCPRIDRQTRPEPELAGEGDGPWQVRAGLEMDGDAV